MNASKLWQDIVKVALVGSDRQSLSLPANSTGSLVELLKEVETEPPAGHLLQVAGTVAVYRQAGFRPPELNATPSIAPAPDKSKDLPPCEPLARRLLGRLLAGEHKQVFPEYLEQMAAAGQRVAAEFLPQLLDRGSAESRLRGLILPVLGKRGQWLATHKPDWDWATVASEATLDLSIWETGSKHARLSLLKELRRQAPEQARELLTSGWKSEKADVRVAQLETLADNLSMADEPWLETLLDDRSKQVRKVAAELLATLPESRLCQRAISRATPLLQMREDRPNIVVELPSEHDAAMERDGILPNPPQKNLGKKAWWLQQTIAMVPPQHWCQHLQNSPQTLVSSIDPKWQGVLVAGWVDATVRHRDAAWAEALLQPALFRLVPTLAARLMPILLSDRQQALCLELLQIPQKDLPKEELENSLVGHLLSNCQGPWSLELVDAVVTNLSQALSSKQKNTYQYQYQMLNCLTSLALCFPINEIEKASESIKKLEGIIKDNQDFYYVDRYLSSFYSLLEFRQQLHQAFPETPVTV